MAVMIKQRTLEEIALDLRFNAVLIHTTLQYRGHTENVRPIQLSTKGSMKIED